MTDLERNGAQHLNFSMEFGDLGHAPWRETHMAAVFTDWILLHDYDIPTLITNL